jgi:hypothetical protein
MAFPLNRLNVSRDFSTADKAKIQEALFVAYNGSSIARAMFDDYFSNVGSTIDINYQPDTFRVSPIDGTLFIDLKFIEDFYYINGKGTPVRMTLVGAVLHELGHAINSLGDSFNILDGDFLGENQTFINGIWKQLGLEPMISYVGQGWEFGKGPKQGTQDNITAISDQICHKEAT